MKVAEAPAEGNVLRGCQMLVANDQDAMVEMRPLDTGEGIVRQRPGEVGADDLGAERRRKRPGVAGLGSA